MRRTMPAEGISGLILWDELDDPYDHNELVENWVVVATHDHVFENGGGNLIGTDALVDHAVTHDKLAQAAVSGARGPGPDNIYPGSVCAPDIGDDCITPEKLKQDLFHKIVPLGSILMWYREVAATPPPDGWVICDGTPLPKLKAGVVQHDFAINTFPVPNLIDRFVIGAGGAVAENAKGGDNAVRVLQHQHTFSFSHKHGVPAGTFDHTHSVGDHGHSVAAATYRTSVDGAHGHVFGANDDWHGLATRPIEIYQGTYKERRQALYVKDFNEDEKTQSVAIRPSEGNHSHAVTVTAHGTGQSGAGSTTPYNHGAITTDDPSPASGTTDATAPTVNILPAYVGLLFIMKVRKPTS